MPRAARRQRRGLGLGIGVDADQHLLALLDRFDARSVGFDQRLFHVVDGRNGPALRLERASSARACPSALRPCGRSRPNRRRCRHIPAGRSRRRRSAEAGATIAGPKAAAGRALRSRRGVARLGRARFSTASRRASKARCDRGCSRAAARSAPANSPARRSGSGGAPDPLRRNASRRSRPTDRRKRASCRSR